MAESWARELITLRESTKAEIERARRKSPDDPQEEIKVGRAYAQVLEWIADGKYDLAVARHAAREILKLRYV